MTTQTRLDQYQKQLLEYLWEDYKDVFLFHFPTVGTGVCVAIKQTGIDTAKFAVSIASPEERVYRYDVAEYVALNRWAEDMVMPCSIPTRYFGESASTILGQKAFDIATAVA